MTEQQPQTWDEHLNELWERGKAHRETYRAAAREWRLSGDALSDPCRVELLASCGCLPAALLLSPCPGHPA